MPDSTSPPAPAIGSQPRWIDLQCNGFGGVDFNGPLLDAATLRHACLQARQTGTHRFLATFITDDLTQMVSRIERLVSLRQQDPFFKEIIAGIHIEGPFISPEPGYVGAHPAEHVRPADEDLMQRLIDAGQGLVRLVTLAPEQDPGFATIRRLARQGITISSGHGDPTLDTLRRAIDSGLTMITHLGNGCPLLLHRHDSIITRALSLADHLWCCFIADGAHIPFHALGVYLKAAGLHRSIIVTDAMSAAGLGPGTYRLGAREVEIGADLIAWGPGKAHLVGSTVTMHRTESNLRDQLHLTPSDLETLLIANPQAAVSLAE